MLMHVYTGRAAEPLEVTKLKSSPTNLINWAFALGEKFASQYFFKEPDDRGGAGQGDGIILTMTLIIIQHAPLAR